MDNSIISSNTSSLNLKFGEEYTQTELKDAQVVILPIPYEFSTSFGKGTGMGPEAILNASPYLEFYDEEFDCEPWRAGIYTAPPIPPLGDPERMMKRIADEIKKYLESGKRVIVLGGEHSITYGEFKAYSDKFTEFSILQFDAHSDLRENYEGTIYSHASVMRRIYNENQNIVQVGIRSQSREERDLIEAGSINIFYAHTLHKKDCTKDIISKLKENVFITFDVDFWDPAIMPSTGTPEPGGFFWQETIEMLNAVGRERIIIGMDVVELSPQKNLTHPDFSVAKLVYKSIGLLMLHGRINATC